MMKEKKMIIDIFFYSIYLKNKRSIRLFKNMKIGNQLYFQIF